MKTNKVILNGETLIDLTKDTAVESDVKKSKIFHKANGEQALGTYDIPSGTISITKNDTYNVTNYETANVSVPYPVEVSTEAEMTALLTGANDSSVGGVYKYVGTTTSTYTKGELYILSKES